MIKRLLEAPETSFFLFGPRGVGKSTWLKSHFSEELRFDLLESRHFLEFSRDPGLLEAKIGKRPKGSWVFIDEIQKLPILLDEVHRLIESRGYRFGLTGSSAAIANVAKSYGVYFQKSPGATPGAYLVDHSRATALYGTDGAPIAFIPENGTPEEIARELGRWVK